MIQNSQAPVEGKPAIVDGLAQCWQTFGTLEHDLLRIYGTDTAFCLEALNHYTTADGRAVTLRAVAFTDRAPNGLAISRRFSTDTSALFENRNPDEPPLRAQTSPDGGVAPELC